MPRTSRISRQSFAGQPVRTLEHDGVAISLQAALGSRVLLIRVIGEGGMGRVYLGRDPQLKRFVAVKVLVQAGPDAEAHARFQREAQAIAAVSHPNVVGIYSVGDLPDGTPYFVMEYVSGGSMSERLMSKGPLEIAMAESVIGDVAAALAAAHKRGIVHRDVKPANVLWDEDAGRATVTDFGIAGLMSDDESDIRITAGGMTLGSPAYMSPEQLLAEPMTPKSDIYALGVLGYELLTARGPYQATSPAAIASAHLREEPRRLSEMRQGIPPVLDALLFRCLAKNASDRPTAEEVTAALSPGGAEALEWPPPGLERARGALWRLINMPALGTLLLLVPLLVLVSFGHDDLIENNPLVPVLLAVSSLLGFAAFVRAGLRAWRLADVLTEAARLEYSWGTLSEVFVDYRGDTGSLIAGTREYAVLTPGTRSVFRALRVLRGSMLFLAAPVALVMAFFALATFGSTANGGAAFLIIVGASLLALSALGVVAGMPEDIRLHHIRRMRGVFPSHSSDLELAPAWYAAFERAREEQPFGRGFAVRRFSAAAVSIVFTSGVLLCVAFVFSVSVLTLAGQASNAIIKPAFASWMVYIAERNDGGRSYRLPPDESVTPIQAGNAVLSVASTARRRPVSALERPINKGYPRWERIIPPTGLFTGSRDRKWTYAAILAAPSGFVPAQREFLTRAAAHPARDEFETAARARSLDVFGALLRLPTNRPLHPVEYPEADLFGVRDAAESHEAQVALDVADHKYADAERHAREIIAIGDELMEMPFGVNVAHGYQLLQSGVSTLESVYIATGRERDARVLMDSIVIAGRRIRSSAVRPGLQQLQRLLRNDRYPRGLRLEMTLGIIASACADPRQLLFGIDSSTRGALAYARDSLARYPSEVVWVDAVSAMVSGTVVSPRRAGEVNFLTKLGSVVDGVVGGHRFENCALQSQTLSERF